MTSKCSKWHQQPFINPLTNRKIRKMDQHIKNWNENAGPPPRRSSPRRSSPRRLSSPQRRPDQRIQLYCGNNARDEGLITEQKS